MGLAMALAQNPDAMEEFARLSDEERQQLLHDVHEVESKAEMRALVDHLTNHRPT